MGIVIYVAAFETEGEAIEAVASMLPSDEILEFVIGTANELLITTLKLRPGMVELLV